MTKQVIAVTGCSGFIGSHIVDQLLKDDYTVRAIVRKPKVDQTIKTYRGAPNLQVVAIDDIATDNLDESFRGTSAVIHAACPLPFLGDCAKIVEGILEGTRNVLRTIERVGIRKLVYTGSWASTMDPDLNDTFRGIKLDENSWGFVTSEQVDTKNDDPNWSYGAAKILTEQELWGWAKRHPEVDVTSFIPPLVYGPYLSGYPPPKSPQLLGTNMFPYQLIIGEEGRPLPPPFPHLICDVRDVAEMHVRALTIGPIASGKNKRFLISSDGHLTWIEGARHLKAVRPNLKSRLPDTETPQTYPGILSTINHDFAVKELGFRPRKWETTLVDTIDDMLRIEPGFSNMKAYDTFVKFDGEER